ncbi:MAG: hypothetical protein ACT4SY_06950, partial [Hyphomicrobiales bacterium]
VIPAKAAIGFTHLCTFDILDFVIKIPSSRRKPGPIHQLDAMRIRFDLSVGPGLRRDDGVK